MTTFQRLKASFVMAVCLAGLLIIVGMLASERLISIAFSPMFFIPTFVLAYLFAPIITAYIPYKRRRKEQSP